MRKTLRAFLFPPSALTIVLSSLMWVTQMSRAQTITAERIPTAIADGGGTGAVGFPYAVFVRIQGNAGVANAQAFIKLYNSTNNEFMWSGTGVWSNGTTFSAANQPAPFLNAQGNWAGWIYAKHFTAAGPTLAVRARINGNNYTSGAAGFTVLNTSQGGNGGWIVRQTSPAVNKVVGAYAGGTMVGSYRSEDNGIAEGYSLGPGGWRIAVPAGGIDSLVSFNDDSSRDQVFTGPWTVTAGQETDASVSGGEIGRGSAAVTPALLAGGQPGVIRIALYGQTPGIITTVRCALPAGWLWSNNPNDVTVTGGGSPLTSVAGDTLVLGSMALAGGDSVILRVQSVIPPDTTARMTFSVRTGTHPDSVFSIGTPPSLLVYGTPLPLGAVKANDASGVPLLQNRLVTVRGVVTVGNEFGGGPSFIQDNSGGLAIFGPALSRTVRPGDEILVTGTVSPFSGLTEITGPILHGILSTGNAVDPLPVTAGDLSHDGEGGVEVYEGRLVRVDNIVTTATGTWGSGANYLLIDQVPDTVQIRIDDSTGLVGMPVPVSTFSVVGVVGQFRTVAPFIGGYQVMPRSGADIQAAGPVISSVPVESQILPGSLTVTWQTLSPGTSRLRYGKTPALELGLAGDDASAIAHVVTLTGLQSATVYYLRAFSSAGTDTSFASLLVASTASPAQSTGTINVYFNKTVFTSLARPVAALGNQDFPSKIIGRINAARRSIDVALYSLSGVPGENVASALIAARGRGIKVRVVCEADNRNTNAFTNLNGAGVPVIDDKFDPVTFGAGLMHNKFFVIDGRGGAPESVWVWTGSWNVTLPGTNDDDQNVMEIQDAALAGAYTLEFEEMWGSATDVPNASVSRFGARKTDNTPHRFVIGGRAVECYFSPSDRVTSRIAGAIQGAQHSVAVATMTLTRSDIAAALVAQKGAGRKVRIILDNNTDSGSQYPFLAGQGLDILLKSGAGIFHHKYVTIDAEEPAWNSVVLTGSHNWSNAAENVNNENTLVVHDGPIANQYLQEFAARYYQYGGRDSILSGAGGPHPAPPVAFALEQNFPNPFNPTTRIQFTIAERQLTVVSVYDLLGREVSTLVNEVKAPGTYTVAFDGATVASGMYFCRLAAGGNMKIRKMLLVR